MAKLSKEQIVELKRRFIFRRVILLADGYKLTLKESRFKQQLRVELFVNGTWNGKWITCPDEYVESKFYMPWISYVKKSPRSNKRKPLDMGMRRPDFASIGQALRYLNKVCDDIEILEGDE